VRKASTIKNKEGLFQFTTEKNKSFSLNTEFLLWLSGFADAESNFNISLRNYKDNKYNSFVITFQIGLHIDDLPVLNYIRSNLNCGHISISGNKCNYFVNDQYSLINIILPIFKTVQLNSSKYYQFLIFEKAVNLIKDKKHLSSFGRLKIIEYYNEMKISNLNSLAIKNMTITDYWLGGFTEGDASFSSSPYGPRLKFENHAKEIELFQSIKQYFNHGNLNITKPRKNISNSNATVVLEIKNIHVLKNVIIPFYLNHASSFAIKIAAKPEINNYNSNLKILQTKKYLDFCDWSILVYIYYYGYHRLPEGNNLINEIKSKMNNFRLTTFVNKTSQISNIDSNLKPSAAQPADLIKMESELINFINLEVNQKQNTQDKYTKVENIDNYWTKDIFNSNIYKQDQLLSLILINLIKNQSLQKKKELTIIAKIFLLFSLPSPYEIRDGIRFIRNSSNLVSDKLKIIAIEAKPENNNILKYSSITECSKELKIGRTIIKNCILSGQYYKNFKFKFDL
jgi:hypothetical protein